MVAFGSRSVSRLSWCLPFAGTLAGTLVGGDARALRRKDPRERCTRARREQRDHDSVPGIGNAGQSQLLLAGFTPNSCGVAGPTANFDGGSMQVAGPDQITCYYSSVSPGTPMAFLEQVVETARVKGSSTFG